MLDTTSKGWLFWLILLLSILMSIAGGMYWGSTAGAAIGIVGGVGLALFVGIVWIMPVFNADSYVTYESTAPVQQVVTERVTLVIKVAGLPDKMIHGLSRDELRLIGECVTDNNLYVFSVQHFKDYFKNSGTDGYSLYNKSVRWMQDCGALIPNSKGGYDVSDPIGKGVFVSMRDEAWEVLEEIGDPIPFQPL